MPEPATRARPRSAVIQGKLAPPPVGAQVVVRPRLERLLANLVEQHRVVLVTATAGSGKTTAVTEAARVLGRRVAWLSVDRTDAAPGRLVVYLEAALARHLPQVDGAASAALAAGVPHPEAAGLLAEAVGEESIVLVIDDLERLDDSREPWAVIEALVRYAPAGLRVVLISRRAIPIALAGWSAKSGVAALGDADLAFTPSEAAHMLAGHGDVGIDAAAAVEATGGWVTGILFEAWRANDHVPGVGGEVDPLHGYLAAHIFDQLAPEDRDFLVTTSLLDEVSAERAVALGLEDAGARLAALRAAHLPVSWSANGRKMHCHPRFREYLLERLQRRSSEQVQALRVAVGRLLVAEGRDEDATEEFLRAGATHEALAPAERAIGSVIDRLDFDVAERWLQELAHCQPRTLALAEAELMAAIARDSRRGVAICDRLEQTGEREQLARRSDRVAGLMAWCYLIVGRLDDAHRVLDAANGGPGIEVLRYTLSTFEPGPPPPRPHPSGGPLDALLLSADIEYGRLDLGEAPRSRWATAIRMPFLEARALAAAGRTARALELYEHANAKGVVTAGYLAGWIGPEILIDAGRPQEARAALTKGRRLAIARDIVEVQLFTQLMEAKLALQLERDPRSARSTLDRLERAPGARQWPHIKGRLDTWYGYALLLEHDDDAALARLRAAVELMESTGLILELPTAATYLAEAEWRAGNEDAADRAADIALDAARRIGSNHRLLQALVDFPAVASRRIDAEAGVDSPWHELGRALIAQRVPLDMRLTASVQLRDFGPPAIAIDGDEARPRIAKSYELLAYLVHREARTERDELLEALFEGRTDEPARAYLRQAIHWLRRILPDGSLVADKGAVSLSRHVRFTADSARFEALLAEAARLQGEDRLAATSAALALYDQGAYLEGIGSEWVDVRSRELAARAVDARYDAGELAFALGRYGEAERFKDEVVRADPLREAAYRLGMRIANALGDDDSAIAAYDCCKRALAEIGIAPSPSTRALLDRLRH